MPNANLPMLQESQLLQLAELFDYVEDVRFWIKDREGRFCWVNRAFWTTGPGGHAGGNARDVLGKTTYDVVPSYLADQYLADDEHVLAGNRIVNRIELVHLPDGTTAWHVTNKIPLFASDGTIIGTAGVSRRLNTSGEGVIQEAEFPAVLSCMRDHYGSPITNGRLARLAHMSVRAFERKFQARFHLTPQAYLRKLRLRIASRALVYTNQSLAQIAASCGFANQSHFTREFHRHFGRTPRQYREHYGKETADAAAGTKPAADPQ